MKKNLIITNLSLALILILFSCNQENDILIVNPIRYKLNFYDDNFFYYTRHRLNTLEIELEFINNSESSILLTTGESKRTDWMYICQEKKYNLINTKNKIILNGLSTCKEIFELSYLTYPSLYDAYKSSPCLNDSSYNLIIPPHLDSLKEKIKINTPPQHQIPIEFYYNNTKIDTIDYRFYYYKKIEPVSDSLDM